MSQAQDSQTKNKGAGGIYPLRHISIRVPWHDNGWNGTVCQSPKHNTACLKLINIANDKDDALEEECAGKSLKGLDSAKFPPCVKERGTFMADFSLERYHKHPYAQSSPDTHAHFRPTPLHYPAYGAAAVPFRWMLVSEVFGDKSVRGLVKDHPLDDVDKGHEPNLPFPTSWLQDHRNQRVLLDYFWSHVQLEESLVFFYAKQVPLVEDTGRRVLLGAGRVLRLDPLTEYAYGEAPEGKIRSLLWERMVTHSIRPGFKDGFLLPYHEALRKSNEGRKFNPANVVAFAPEDRFTEFSYATEHVGHDAAIESLLACRTALSRAGELFNVDIANQESWIDQQLGHLWKKRGAFPGLGAVLSANGVPMGNFVAHALQTRAGDEENPWQTWSAALDDPKKYLPDELARRIDGTTIKAWQGMSEERRQFLSLLSRIDLTADQANILAVPEERQEIGLSPQDGDFLRNPYLFYETTRLTNMPVAFGTVDRGLFPTKFVRDKFPLQDEAVVKSAVDGRRLRALTIRELEAAALQGDTLRPQSDIINNLRSHEQQQDEGRTPVTADHFAVAERENFADEIHLTKMADDTNAYQLGRLAKMGEQIRSEVNRRIGGKRHELNIDWHEALDGQLDDMLQNPDEKATEKRAREEKAAALKELAASRFSVLIGPAGTGKTTLLSVLCSNPQIYEGGIVLLAPTGKARVRMEDVARQQGTQNFSAYTLAQFLSRSSPRRYVGETQSYRLTGKPGDKVGRTVIVDECSMLTEEMMAALLEGLSGVHRLIFVGDPRQLPPIGPGRPFADIITHLQPEGIESQFPRIGSGYAELTVHRRQGAGERDDLQLASWYGGQALSPGEDAVFEILSGARESDTVQFLRWETPDELEDLLATSMAETLNFDEAAEEWRSFALSLGGSQFREHVYFNLGRLGRSADAWQILCPVRQKPWGADNLNRALHVRYKARQLEVARRQVPPRQRRLPKPFGDDQIVYGDKVINVRNQQVKEKRVYPKPKRPGYLANGEVGMVIGQLRTQRFNHEPKHLQIEFSTQQSVSYTFYRPGGDDDSFSLELAYALTVHKAQGSEFDVVFLVLPHTTQMLTRELLYTALTRQKRKVVVLHQGSAVDLQRLSSERYSATATRLTNLFDPPELIPVGDGTFLEAGLIHRTSRGEAVRSKSEVIIANLLHAKGVDYHYEHPLELGGVVKYPDFTIEDDAIGITYYWEHCGLLHDQAYRERWESKQQWYREQGILPLSEGGGTLGTLIVTEDQPDGGIDSSAVAELIKATFQD